MSVTEYNCCNLHRHSAGFTQIELIVTIAVSSVILVGITALVGQFFSVSREEAQHVFSTETARGALKRVAGTVRDASPVDCNGDGTISGLSEQWLQEYTADKLTIFGNEDQDVEPERVTFERIGTDITRTVQDLQVNTCAATSTPPAIGTIVSGVRNDDTQPVFQYLDASGTVLDPATLNPTNVARVGFSVFIDPDPNIAPDPTQVETVITPRVSACRQQQCAPGGAPPPDPIVIDFTADADVLPPPAPYPNDHLAHVPLEQGSGRTVNIYPSGGRGNFTNSPQWSTEIPSQSGLFGFPLIDSNYSVEFPGNNDHIALGNIGISGTQARSISLWFRADRFTLSGFDNALFAYSDSARPGGDFVIGAEARDHGGRHTNQISVAVDGHRVITTGGRTAQSLNTGEWYHVVVTHGEGQQSDDFQIYINGEWEPVEEESGSPQIVDTEHRSIYLGNFPGAPGSFQGLIDDVRIFDRVLTQQEAQFIYRNDLDGEASYTNLWWDITGPSGTECVASSNPDNGSWSEAGGVLQRLNFTSFISPRESTEYTVSCDAQDPPQQESQSVTVDVRQFPVPNITFTATERSTSTQHYAADYQVNNISVPRGEVLDLAWSAANATECTYTSSVGGSGGPLTPPQLVDDGDAEFAQSGLVRHTGTHRYDGDLYHSPARGGTGANQASWTFTVAPGDYQVQATWRRHSNRATNATFTIEDEGIPVHAETVNQQLYARDDHTEGGRPFQNLGGPVSIAGTTLTVVLTDNANGYVIADAIRVEPVGGGTGGTIGGTVVGTQSVVVNEDQTLALSCNNQGDPPVIREFAVTVNP